VNDGKWHVVRGFHASVGFSDLRLEKRTSGPFTSKSEMRNAAHARVIRAES
jgi:hypothetical protein